MLMLLRAALALAVFVGQCLCAGTFNLTSTNSNVASLNNLTFALSRSLSTPPAATSLQLDFPDDFNVATLTSGSTINTTPLSLGGNLTVSNSTTLVITLPASLQTTQNLVIVLIGVTNPTFVTLIGNIVVQFIASGSNVETVTANPLFQQNYTTAGVLSSCQWAFSPQTNSNGNLLLTFQLQHSLPAGNNSIILGFTNSWSNIKNVSLMYGLVFRNNTLSSLSSSNITFNSPTSITALSLTSLTSTSLTISFTTSAILSAFTTMSITIAGVETPPTETINPSTELLQITTNNGKGTVDQSGVCTAPAIAPYTLSSCAITSTGAMVSQTFSLQGTLGNILNNEIQKSDVVVVTYPSGVTAVSNYIYFQGNSQAVISSTTSPTGNNQSMSITSINPSNANYSFSNIPFTFGLINNITLPNSVAPITFDLTFYRSGMRYMQCQPQLTTISTGSVSSILLSSSPTTVGVLAAYNLTFTLQHSITAGGGFNVTLPSTIGLSQLSTCTSTSVTLACSVDSPSNTIIVNATNTVSASVPFSVTFGNLQNPAYPYKTIAVSVKSFNDATRMNATSIDSGSGTPSTIYSVATLATPIVGNISCNGRTLENCLYTLNYTNTVALQTGIVVQLILPAALVAVTSYTSTFQCGTQTTISSSTVSSPLQFTLAAACPISSSLYIKFEVTNPSQTGTYTGLQILHLTNATGDRIEQALTGISISVPNPSLFSMLTITNDLPWKTGQTGELTFNFQSSVQLPAGTYFSVQYPSAFSGWSTATCKSGCTFISFTETTVLVNTTAASVSGNTSSFKLQNLKFPRSYKPCNFVVTAYSDAAMTVAYHQSPYTFAMASANTMTVAFQSGLTNYRYSTDPILLTFTFSNSLVQGDIVQVSLPSIYLRVSGVTITSDGSFSFVESTPGVINATVTSTSLGTSANMSIIGFKIDNITQPIGNIYATHYDGIYLSDSQASVAFSLTCTYPCRTCLTTNLSHCTSCYNQSIQSSYYFFNSSTGTCVNICSTTSQYYADSASMCLSCVSPCLQCTNDTFCNSCLDPTKYLFADGTCGASCNSTGFFNRSYSVVVNTGQTSTQYQCLACSPACYECVSSATKCLKCANASLVLWPDNTCVSTVCQDGYYNNSGICSLCLTDCLTCTNLSSCLTCVAGYVFNSINQCVSQCGSQVLEPISNKCVCGQNCVTCVNNINNCTSCASSFYLQSSACVATCNASTYNSSGVCYDCPVGCSACTSSQLCSSCLSTYYLYNNSCLTSCRILGDGFVNYDAATPKTCTKCAAGCSVCQPATPSNCSACLANYTLNSLTNLCECANCNSSTTVMCPVGFTLENGACVVGKATISGQLSIVMYSIIAVVWSAFCLVSKLFAKTVFVQYAMISGLAPLEVTSYMVLLAFTIPSSSSRRLLATTVLDAGTICVIVALALNYVMNALHVWIHFRYIRTDDEFPKNKKHPRNKALDIVLLVFATLTNFRLYQIVFSSLCNVRLFKTRLLNVSKLMPINLLNCGSVAVSVLALAGFGLICAKSVSSQSEYYLSIIAIVIIVLTVIFTLASFLKDEEFFDEVCKYDGTDEISNTQQALEGGQEHQFNSNMVGKGKNYKIMNEPSIALINEEDRGDMPINKKGSYLNDPLKPIIIRSESSDFPDLEIPNPDNSGDGHFENSDTQSKEDVGGRSMSKIRKKASRRTEQRSGGSLLRIQQNKGQEEIEEEKVDTIINELDSSISLQSHQNQEMSLRKKQSSSPRDGPLGKRAGSTLDHQKKNLNLVQVHPDTEGSDAGVNKHISSTRMIQIKPKEEVPRQTSAQRMEPAGGNLSDSLSENTQPANPKIDLKFIEKFYQEGNFEFSEPDIEYNQVSPSQFNIENQRFDDSMLQGEASESGDNGRTSHQAAARSTPLKNFSLEQLRKDFD